MVESSAWANTSEFSPLDVFFEVSALPVAVFVPVFAADFLPLGAFLFLVESVFTIIVSPTGL